MLDESRRQRCIQAVVEEGERFGVLAAELDAGTAPSGATLDSPVPWIPVWTARDLVGHLAGIHRWSTHILRAGVVTPPPPETRPAPPAQGLLGWYAEGLAELVQALREVPADSPAWHMSPAAGRVAADWARRQAHELAVHRMDLEATAGVPLTPVHPQLADDGVDELLTTVLARWVHTAPFTTADATVRVVSRDTGRSWTVRLAPGEPGTVVITGGGDGPVDAVLEGGATDLLLRLWGRPARVDVSGDPAAEALLRGR
ncbi:maleylpyruvate isomerase family mycothiol-dependent enzyme [Geodermatophilus sp. YIM 151500]|uniref:maleylpyruvate isomerase N-terminal domain-containing protein n=1 Tax=Geodermatophilus sp. YIM 151500 TaxID=2984531 RepID=UPI0021E48A61|nr:maleylpyruvate isomerase N-terminal domain-containing protein [Geodermatophilus sp. YIM 151500]MCV2490386.1 maleylpyruvate isomerase family mycothiol-dependent enzyme [Geodermatophilus sp. YIM 151500]